MIFLKKRVTSMRIVAVTHKEAAGKKNIFIPLFQKESLEKEEIFSSLMPDTKRLAKQFASREFKGEAGETKSLWLHGGPSERIVLFGLGEKKKWNERMNHLLPRRMVQYAKANKIEEFAVAFKPEAMRRFGINALMADFEFNAYKERPKGGWPQVKTIYLALPKEEISAATKKLREELIIGEEVNATRDLANTPGGDMTPAKLAEAAAKAAETCGFRIKILEEKDMKKLGMGGVLGVARGSDEKPKF